MYEQSKSITNIRYGAGNEITILITLRIKQVVKIT